MAHAVDLLVDRGFLLDIGVGARHIGFRLVVIVVGDEIFDRVVRKEARELAIELGGERLVGRENERRALGVLDDMRHGEGLARAGDAEQHLVALDLRMTPSTSSAMAVRLVALRLESARRSRSAVPPSDFSGRGGRYGVNVGRFGMSGRRCCSPSRGPEVSARGSGLRPRTSPSPSG